MSFQTKDFLSITASMINRVRVTTTKITDFNIGAVARTLLEAVAQELDQLYQEMLHGLVESIPVAIYNGFGFPANPASPASGLVLVTIAAQTTDTLIPAATQLSTAASSIIYTTSSDVTILAGRTAADVLAVAAVAGSAGNVPGTATFTLSPAPQGFVSATAVAPFTNGVDAETSAAQQARFAAYIAALPRGTLAALTYGLTLATITNSAGLVTERVAMSLIVEPWLTDPTQHPAIVLVYIHNGVGATSSALVAQAQAVMNGYVDSSGNVYVGWKAAGVNLTVCSATDTALPVTMAITCHAAYAATIAATAQAAVSAYLLSLPIAGTFIHAEAEAIVMGLTGVTNVAISSPGVDTAVGATAKFIPGTFSVTVTSV